MNFSLKKILARIVLVLAALTFVFAWIRMLERLEPFYSWFYSFAWWSYILFVEAFLYLKNRYSLLFSDPIRFAAHLPLSVAIWLVFEVFNFRLNNWHYVNLPSETPLRWLGYTIAFATVLPGLFTTKSLLESLGILEKSRSKPLADPRKVYGWFYSIGALFLILPLLFPRLFFPLVWGGFIFLLEPLNHRLGVPSLLAAWEKGSLRPFYLLLLAGALCGLFWEFWNFWAGAKWVYTVPYVGFLKIFEMPILGFLGFPPFAVECYAAAGAYFWFLEKTLKEPDSQGRKVVSLFQLVVWIVFCVLVFAGIDRYTVVSFR